MKKQKVIERCIRSLTAHYSRLGRFDCGRAMYGDRIEALEWVLDMTDTLCGHRINENGVVKEVVSGIRKVQRGGAHSASGKKLKGPLASEKAMVQRGGAISAKGKKVKNVKKKT